MEVDGKSVRRSGKRRKTCCIAVIGSIVGIVILIVILAFTVFKAKRPVTTYDNLSIKDLDVSLDIAKVRVYINVSVGADVSVYNPNKVGYKYDNSTALLNYRGQLVGEAPLMAGEITAGGTEHINLTLTVMADRLLSNSDILSDVTSGALSFNTVVKLSGKVKILFSRFTPIHPQPVISTFISPIELLAINDACIRQKFSHRFYYGSLVKANQASAMKIIH